EQAEKLFVWFALGRVFAHAGYPMWSDAFELWPPMMDAASYASLVRFAYAIGFAENECVSISFPANNPIKGALELHVANPMTPLAEELRATKEALAGHLLAAPMSYFSQGDSKATTLEFKPRTKFDKVLERRLALASYLLASGRSDVNLGRTKLAKLIYLSDAI